MRTRPPDDVPGIRTGEDRVYDFLLKAIMCVAAGGLVSVFYYAMVINPLDVVDLHPFIEAKAEQQTDKQTRPPDALTRYGESYQIRQMTVRQP